MEVITRKLVLVALIVVISISSFTSQASSPSDQDYRVTIDYSGDIYFDMWDYHWNLKASDPTLQLGERKSVSFYPAGTARARFEYDFTDLLSDYYPFMSTATNVWMSLKVDMDQSTIGTSSGGFSAIYSHYDIGGGVVEDLWYSETFSGNSAGVVQLPIYDFGDKLRGIRDFESFAIIQRIDINSNATDFEYVARVNSFALILYLEGVSGTNIDMTIVIDGGLKNIESAVDGVKDEVQAIKGQLDSVLTPDQDDQDAANGFLDKVEDNKQDAADINDQLSSVSRPDPGNLRDEVNPDQYIDKDDASVQEMSGLIASVFDIDVMVRYILVLLGLGLISLVFFGKKDG